MIHSLENLVHEKIRSSLREAGLLADGAHATHMSRGPVFLFGGGQHTWWLGREIPEFRHGMVDVACVIDDQAKGRVGVWDCMTAAEAVRAFGTPRVVVLSTDTHQKLFTGRAREAFGSAATIVDLYAGLPAGPYPKSSPERFEFGRMLTGPSADCLVRTASAMSRYLADRHVRRVYLIGQTWQQQAFARGLKGVEHVAELATADAAIVCSEESEIPAADPLELRVPGLDGPVLTLKTGERPWFDRGAESGSKEGLCTDRVRIAIRHDELLGDVVLSQGILPERIKREVYPNAHITFITARSASRRPGSETTGWAVDAVRHNPWIDEVLDCERFGPGTCWWAGYDRAYLIITNGGVYDHVFDVQAMHVELPPGRTDAKLYLCDADRILARTIVDSHVRGNGPTIAVNMSLAAERLRGWGPARTAELCERLEGRLGASIVWMGWTDLGPYKRLVDPQSGRALSVREQAAVMQQCDLHITCQGGGANMSAAVGCQTLALSGLHHCRREGVAYFNNRYISDTSRRHVELYRYDDGSGEKLRILNYASGLEKPWRLDPSLRPGRREARTDVLKYEMDIWGPGSPLADYPRDAHHLWRTWNLSVEDVFNTAEQMLEARRTGRPVPGE